MNRLDNISCVYRIDAKKSHSNEEEIKALQDFSTIDVPTEYIEIIQLASDIEINVNDQIYIRIWRASGCIEMNETYEVQKYLPNSLAIGDDEGGDALIYLQGKDGFGIYYNRFTDLDIEEPVKIAPSLTELLVNNVGRKRPLFHLPFYRKKRPAFMQIKYKLVMRFHITYSFGDGNLAASKCVLFSTVEITPATLLCAKTSTTSPAFN